MAKQLTLGLTRTSMALFRLAVLIAVLVQSLIFDSLAKTVNFDLKVKYLANYACACDRFSFKTATFDYILPADTLATNDD